jgi:hypothetical protein
MGVDEKNLDTARTAVPLLYRQQNPVISAKNQRDAEKHRRQSLQVPKNYVITHSTLNDKRWNRLAGDALHIA